MTKPLALLLYEKMMPGSQVAADFEMLDYRVLTLNRPGELAETARRTTPMLVVADLSNRNGDVLAALAELQKDPGTSHLPVIAFGGRDDDKLREAAHAAGVKIVATDATIRPHLRQFIEQALQIE